MTERRKSGGGGLRTWVAAVRPEDIEREPSIRDLGFGPRYRTGPWIPSVRFLGKEIRTTPVGTITLATNAFWSGPSLPRGYCLVSEVGDLTPASRSLTAHGCTSRKLQ